MTVLLGAYAFACRFMVTLAVTAVLLAAVRSFLASTLWSTSAALSSQKALQDFWRRWHISLSTWLRDYLYIPLGGSHLGKVRTYINLMLTMLLGGLWHGANWTFVIWAESTCGACHRAFADGRP